MSLFKQLIFIVFSFTVFSYSFSFNFMTYDPTVEITSQLNYDRQPITKKEYLDDLETFRKSEESTIFTICMLQVRNSLYANNLEVKNLLQQTKFNKEKIFDRAALELFYSCKQYLQKKNDVSIYLNPNQITTFNEELLENMKLEKDIFSKEPTFTEIEKEILSVFYNGSLSKQKKDKENASVKKIDFSASTPVLYNSFLERILDVNIFAVKYFSVGIVFGAVIGIVLAIMLSYIKRKYLSSSLKDKEKKRR